VVGWDCRYCDQITSDDSHLWHIHISVTRSNVADAGTYENLMSVIRGETVEQWRKGGTKMEQTDRVIGNLARANTVGDVLADLSNLRDWLVTPPGQQPSNPVLPGSKADRVVQAAQTMADLAERIDDKLSQIGQIGPIDYRELAKALLTELAG
jgi:hypothetical protein